MNKDTIIEPKKFMVIGAGFWGRGNTLKEAHMNAIEACGISSPIGRLIAYAGSDDLSIVNGYVTAKTLIRLGEMA